MTLSPAKACHPPTKKCQVSGWHVCTQYKVLGRSTTPIPKKRVKPRKEVVARTDEAYRDFVRSFPCLLRGRDPAHQCALGILGSEAAHVRSRGAGGADLSNLVNLCHHHHAEQHQMGIVSFQKKHGIDLSAHATALGQVWARCVPYQRAPHPGPTTTGEPK